MISEITFEGDRPSTVQNVNMRLIQREFAHDVVSVVLPYLGYGRYLDQGTPVTLRWGAPPNDISTFLGYVNHTQPVQIPNPGSKERNQIKVVCKSASTALSKPRQQVWNDRTIPSIVRSLLRSHHLSGMIQEDTRIFNSLTCNGQSAWAFIVSLAQRLGWTCYGHGTDVTFRDPIANLGDMKEQAFIFAGHPPGATLPPPDITLYSFQSVNGRTSDGGVNAKRVAQGLDARTLKHFSLSDDGAALTSTQVGRWGKEEVPMRYERFPASDLGEALNTLGGETRRNRWHVQARAEVRGHARVTQGTLVCLIGVGKRESGYWYIEQVEHEMSQDGYRLHLSLGRDSSWDTGERPPQGRVRRIVRPRHDPFGTQIGVVPPSALVNKRWRAEYAAERAVPGVA